MTDATERVFDSGLQAERTALAWRRTSLAMAVAAVGGARLIAHLVPAVALAVAVLGLLQAWAVAGTARWRYRAVHRSLSEQGDLLMLRRAGLPIAMMALGAMGVAVIALVFVLHPLGSLRP